MKKYCYIFLLLLFFEPSQGQTGSIVKENSKWNILRQSYSSMGKKQRTETIIFKKDTTINDTLYKNVYQSFKYDADYSLVGQIREDDSQKVFFRPINYNKEFLLYDFSMTVGDSATVIYWSCVDEARLDLIEIRVDAINTIELDGVKRQKYTISPKYHNQWDSHHNFWISGIGDMEGILYSCHDMGLSGIEHKNLLCFHTDANIVYNNPKYNTCYINNSSSDENEFLVKENSIWNILHDSSNSTSTKQSTETVVLANDTTINDTVYKNVYQSFKYDDNYSLIGQIREESNQKIFFRPAMSNNEFLLYDFGMKVGDIANVICWNGGEENKFDLIDIRVDSIKPIEVDGVSRRKYYIGSKSKSDNTWSSSNIWISGIGDTQGLLYSSSYTDDKAVDSKYLLCYHIDVNLIFKNSEYNNCYIETTATSINSEIIAQQPIMFYDNITNNLILKEDFTSANKLIIFDVNGRVVLIKDLKGYEKYIDLSSLQGGVYIAKLVGSNVNLKFLK